MITRSQATLIEGEKAQVNIDYSNRATLETTTIDNMGNSRRTSIVLDREKAKDIIEVLTDYLVIVE